MTTFLDKATRVTKDEAIKVDVEKQTKDTESKKVEEDLSKTKVSVGERGKIYIQRMA